MDESTDYKALWQQAERERAQERKKREQAERERDQVTKETEHTTFSEFIRNCHLHLSEPLQIETNQARSTKGKLTSPAGRVCPTYLRPWSDFHEHQAQVYQTVLQLLQPTSGSPVRVFPSRMALQDLGHRLCRRRLASEEDCIATDDLPWRIM